MSSPLEIPISAPAYIEINNLKVLNKHIVSIFCLPGLPGTTLFPPCTVLMGGGGEVDGHVTGKSYQSPLIIYKPIYNRERMFVTT